MRPTEVLCSPAQIQSSKKLWKSSLLGRRLLQETRIQSLLRKTLLPEYPHLRTNVEPNPRNWPSQLPGLPTAARRQLRTSSMTRSNIVRGAVRRFQSQEQWQRI